MSLGSLLIIFWLQRLLCLYIKCTGLRTSSEENQTMNFALFKKCLLWAMEICARSFILLRRFCVFHKNLGNRLITTCNGNLMTGEKRQCVQNQIPSLETSHSMHSVIWDRHHNFFSYFLSLLKKNRIDRCEHLTHFSFSLWPLIRPPLFLIIIVCAETVLTESHLWWLNSWMDSILSCSDLFYIPK